MIDIKNVSKTYKSKFYEVKALDGVNLHIDKGEILAVMGSSGSGKTTLLNMIGLIDDCDPSGEIIINGERVDKSNREKMRRKYLTYIFQHFALIETDSVFENVELPLVAKNVPKLKRKKIVNDLLERLGISNLKNQPPSKISGGQKQRVAIARAMASGNEIILADEPTGSLDSKNAKEIMKLLREFVDEEKTVIIVTHDPNVAALADRCINIEDGKIV